MVIAYIGIGSNLGNRRKNIDRAIERLNKTSSIEVKRVSSIIETDPVGGPPQEKFLNGVIEIETSLTPRELLSCTQQIETNLGRVRTVKNGPRMIDLDILTYGKKKVNEPDLKIPHPKMHKRDFVLKPLKELLTR